MRKIIYSGVVTLLLILAGCQERQNKKDNRQRIITVTIEPQRYFTEAIAGDKFAVVCMVPKGSSPEAYDPTPQQLVSLGNSDAYFRIGYIGFEMSWMDRLTQNAPHTQLFDISKGVELIYEPGYIHADHTHPGGIDPHIWNSTVNAKIMASNIFTALCALDKENKEYYLARYDSLANEIEETDSLILDLLRSDNEASRTFMIYHPSLSYFARDYGLHQVSIEEGGKEPSPKHLKELIEISKYEGVQVIFVQPEFDKRNAEIIARETGASIVPVNLLSYDWKKEMLHIAGNLIASTPKKEKRDP